jgi:hypothetical protein
MIAMWYLTVVKTDSIKLQAFLDRRFVKILCENAGAIFASRYLQIAVYYMQYIMRYSN